MIICYYFALRAKHILPGEKRFKSSKVSYDDVKCNSLSRYFNAAHQSHLRTEMDVQAV